MNCLSVHPLVSIRSSSTNSSVMAFLGDLMSPRATCVSLGGRRGLVPQLQPLSRGSGRRSVSVTTPIASTSQPQDCHVYRNGIDSALWRRQLSGHGTFQRQFTRICSDKQFETQCLICVVSSHTFHDRKPFIATCKHHSALCFGNDLSYLVIPHNCFVTQNCWNAKRIKHITWWDGVKSYFCVCVKTVL